MRENGVTVYEVQYENGLQEGVSRSRDYKGNLLSEVVFEKGKIVKVNFPEGITEVFE